MKATMKPFACASHGLFAAALIVALSGCASSSDIDSVRQLAQQAMDAASQASAKADQAAFAAKDASQQAQAAAADAARAQQAASDAQSCCQANSEKIERAFKRSMQK